MARTVRFTEVVKTAGKPELYLPLSDPKQDRAFMRAVRDQRVLSLKQEPTGTRKDFGTIGFVAERYVTYLIFPKPLTPFADKRVVGIKYDAVDTGTVVTPQANPTLAKRSTAPKPKPKPRPKRFTATVRVTSTNELKVSVKAFNEAEARSKAEEEAQKKVRAPARAIEAELLSLRRVDRKQKLPA